MNKERIITLLWGQERSTKMWVEQFAKNRDNSSRINAALAVGKLGGMVAILSDLLKGELPEDIVVMYAQYVEAWDQLQQLS